MKFHIKIKPIILLVLAILTVITISAVKIIREPLQYTLEAERIFQASASYKEFTPGDPTTYRSNPFEDIYKNDHYIFVKLTEIEKLNDSHPDVTYTTVIQGGKLIITIPQTAPRQWGKDSLLVAYGLFKERGFKKVVVKRTQNDKPVSEKSYLINTLTSQRKITPEFSDTLLEKFEANESFRYVPFRKKRNLIIKDFKEVTPYLIIVIILTLINLLFVINPKQFHITHTVFSGISLLLSLPAFIILAIGIWIDFTITKHPASSGEQFDICVVSAIISLSYLITLLLCGGALIINTLWVIVSSLIGIRLFHKKENL